MTSALSIAEVKGPCLSVAYPPRTLTAARSPADMPGIPAAPIPHRRGIILAASPLLCPADFVRPTGGCSLLFHSVINCALPLDRGL